MQEARSDYDGAWKEALEGCFAEFMAFFFPQAHAEIDWSRGHEFLDKELQRVAPAAKLGPRRVDKLSKVWRAGGEEAWVLVHVEVQSQDEVGFAERMYVYHLPGAVAGLGGQPQSLCHGSNGPPEGPGDPLG